MGDGFNEVLNLTATTLLKSINVSDEALGLFIQDITIPIVNVIDLQNHVDSINNEVKNTRNCHFFNYIIKIIIE